MAASLLLSPLSASSIDNGEHIGLQNSSFVHNTKRIFAPPVRDTRRNGVRRWCFRSPVAAKSLDHIPKQFREENLKDGLTDNFKNVPQTLYGLNPSQMNMFMSEDNPVRRQSESVTEESISSAYNYLNHGGMYTLSGMNDRGHSKYSMSANMYSRRGGRGGFGTPRTAPPDLPSLLLDGRIVYLGMPIVPAVCELIVAQFLWLNYDNDTKPIYLYLNSTGIQNENREIVGSDSNAFAIADMIKHVKAKVYTVNVAVAHGQAAMLLALGEKGYRALQPNSSTKLYMPSVYRSSGAASDMWIKAKELDTHKEYLLEFLAEGIGKPKEVIAKDIARSKCMLPEAAIEYGVADKIIKPQDITFEKRNHREISAQNKAMRQAATPGISPRAGSIGSW